MWRRVGYNNLPQIPGLHTHTLHTPIVREDLEARMASHHLTGIPQVRPLEGASRENKKTVTSYLTN